MRRAMPLGFALATYHTFLMVSLYISRIVLNVVVSRLVSDSRCSKLLTGDGITTFELNIKGMRGIFDSISVDARQIRRDIQEIGEASSTAKNLDEYQFLICSLVPSLPDSNPSKLQLQKCRIAIIASFAKLVALLKEIQRDSLAQWNKFAKLLLEETSDAYVKAKSNAQLQLTSHKEVFDFFNVPEDKIDAALRVLYGQQ
jgi:ferritin